MKRAIFLVATVALASVPAWAGDSVITFGQLSDTGNSVITVDCATCPPLKEKEHGPAVHGVEVTETIIGGEKKIVQTDNLMGGSAVRYVKTSPSNADSAGEIIAHTGGGTSVTVGHGGTIHVPADMQPAAADAGNSVTYSGGGEFHVEEAEARSEKNREVDGSSTTSSVNSVNMNDAENIVIGGGTAEKSSVVNGTEILELRPTH